MKFQVQPTVFHSTLVEGKKLSYKFYILTCLALTGPDGPRIGPNWPELAQIGPNWPKLAWMDLNWPEMTWIGPDWPKMDPIGSWLAPIGPDWQKNIIWGNFYSEIIPKI